MAYFMCKSDMRDFGRNVGGVVLNGDDSSVERLLLAIRVQLAFLTDASGAPWDGKTQIRAEKCFRPAARTFGLKKNIFQSAAHTASSCEHPRGETPLDTSPPQRLPSRLQTEARLETPGRGCESSAGAAGTRRICTRADVDLDLEPVPEQAE